MHPDITLQRKSLQRIARRVGLQANTVADLTRSFAIQPCH